MSKIDKKDLPKMPDAMKRMVEAEVDRQINSKSKKTFSIKKIIIITLAATLLIGTTAFAGIKFIVHLQSEQKGSYGLTTSIILSEENPQSLNTSSLPDEIPEVKISYKYIPEGMKTLAEEEGKIGYINDFYSGGISSAMCLMDIKFSEITDKLDKNVIYHESLEINGHDAVYFEKQSIEEDAVWFDKKIYVLYAENYMILEMFGGTNISKEEMFKVAKGTTIQQTGNYVKTETFPRFSVPDIIESGDLGVRLAADETEMEGVHEIGETFPIDSISGITGEEINCIEVKVEQVQVFDNLTPILETSNLPDGWLDAVGPNGKLTNNIIKYIKSGDGVQTADEVLTLKEIPQKLVHFTVEYKNTGNEVLKEVLFAMTMMRLTKDTEGYNIYDRIAETGIAECDKIVDSSVGSNVEMMYYDVRGGERHNNYIPEIKPGETVIVHMAQIVNEDELDKLYLNLDIQGAGYEFTEENLTTGLVDVRR